MICMKSWLTIVYLFLAGTPLIGTAFEGRIDLVATAAGQAQNLRYRVTTNSVRVEQLETNYPHPVNLWDRQTQELQLLFPANRSWIALPPSANHSGMPTASAVTAPRQPLAGAPGSRMPVRNVPPGLGPQSPRVPSGPLAGATDIPLELHATGERTNLFGYACERFESNQSGELLEVWATDQLLPYLPYRRSEPLRMKILPLADRWPALLAARNLFPLRLTIRSIAGPETYRLEVRDIAPGPMPTAEVGLFRPPADYRQLAPSHFAASR